MRECPVCHHSNLPEADFCNNCATPLTRVCLSCGQAAPVGNKFCGACGASLPPPATPSPVTREVPQAVRPPPTSMPKALAEKISMASPTMLGQRREVTVVFVDAANFTSSAHTMDSEDVYLLIDEAMRELVDIIYAYEGTVDKFTGDGLMALFGAPIAHEDDPERAVRAAMAMQSVLHMLSDRNKSKYGVDLKFRVGINTGLVVAGGLGGDLHMEYTVIGDTVNLASRLQMAALPGAILVSFSTYERTRALFEYEPRPGLALKGYPAPIPNFQPVSLKRTPARTRGLGEIQAPMVGREGALGQLQNTLAEVEHDRRSRIALVTGEAGLGKTRLVAEFCKLLEVTRKPVFEGSCLAYTRSTPLWVVAEVLRNMMGVTEADAPLLQYKALEALVDYLLLSPGDTLPFLLHLLGLGQLKEAEEARLHMMDASMLQRQTHAVMRQVMLNQAALAPSVFVFEDLHWVDPASRDLIEHLIHTTQDAPLLFVLVSRDAERDTTVHPLIKAAQKTPAAFIDIQLQPLSQPDGRLLVDQLLKQSDSAAEGLKVKIVDRAEGLPFYLEEIIRVLIDRGGLVATDDSWQVTPEAEELLQNVPDTVKGLVLARFDQLAGSLQRTLQIASVVGRSFPLQLLAKLGLDANANIVTQLNELTERRFLEFEPFGADQGFAFRHVLMQDAIYSTLLKRDRQTVHDQVAQAVEASGFWPVEEQAEILAYHFSEGTRPLIAVPYLILSAENAARRYANETAIQNFRQAMGLMQQTSERYAIELIRVQIGLGQALTFSGEFAQAGNILEAAIQSLSTRLELEPANPRVLVSIAEALCELAEVRQRAGALDEAINHLERAMLTLGDKAEVEHPSLWRRLMDRQAWICFRHGKLEDAFALANSAVGAIESDLAEDPITAASLNNTLGGVFWQQGNLAEAAGHVERSLELYKRLGYSFGMANAYTNLGVLYYAQGAWQKAAEDFERSMTLRREIGYLPGQALNLHNLGLLHLAMGAHDRARSDLEASLSISRRLGEDFDIAQAAIGLAQLEVILNRYAEAEKYLEIAFPLLGAAGEDEEIQAQWLLALVQAEHGALPAGLLTVEKALEKARASGLTNSEADCLRTQAQLLSASNQFVEAEVALKQSIELGRQQNDPYRHAQGLLELGRLYQRLCEQNGSGSQVWCSQARASLSEASTLFENLGAAYDVSQTQSLLRKLL